MHFNKLESPQKRTHPAIQYHILQGTRPGPVVMITAGVHGTEIAGIKAAQQLLHMKVHRGTLIIVPIVNENAYRLRTRGRPDINRMFPKEPGSTAKGTIAGQIIMLAQRYKPTWCIDLHEANGFFKIDCSKLGQTIIAYPNRKTEPTLKRVIASINREIMKPSRKFSLRIGKLPGSLRTAMGRILGCHAVTVETSMQQPRTLRIQYQSKIIHFLLKEIGSI